MSKSISIQQPDEHQLSARASAYLDMAKSIEVIDPGTLSVASKYLKDNKSTQKHLEDERKELVAPIRLVVEKINGKFKPAMEVLKEAESIVKKSVGNYQRKEQLRIANEQAKAEEKARKERQRLEERAAKAEESGNDEKAAALQSQAASTVAVAPVAAQKVSGMSIRKVWKAEVIDPVAVCKLIAEGTLPVSMVEFKTAELNRVASVWQDKKEFIGLRIHAEISASVR